MLSYFSLLDIDLFVLVTDPAGCDSCQKKSCETKQTFVNFNFSFKLKYIAIAAQLVL